MAVCSAGRAATRSHTCRLKTLACSISHALPSLKNGSPLLLTYRLVRSGHAFRWTTALKKEIAVRVNFVNLDFCCGQLIAVLLDVVAVRGFAGERRRRTLVDLVQGVLAASRTGGSQRTRGRRKRRRSPLLKQYRRWRPIQVQRVGAGENSSDSEGAGENSSSVGSTVLSNLKPKVSPANLPHARVTCRKRHNKTAGRTLRRESLI